MRHKEAIKMKGLVKPAKSKPSVGQKKKAQPKNDSGTARNGQDKSVRGKRKKAVTNNRMDAVHQEALGSQNKISPMKKRKLDPINVVTPSASEEKKMPVEVREEEKLTVKMSKSKENLLLYKQVYINVMQLDKSSLNGANISKRKEIVVKKMKEDIETDQLKDKPNSIENSETILKLEQIIDKLKSQNVTLQDENKSKNEALNSVIKEKEEYMEKCVNEAQKCTTMIKSVKEEGEARQNWIDRLVSEKEALEAEIKNKDKTLNLVSKDKDEVSLKFKEASQKLICQVQFNQGLIEEVVGLKNNANFKKPYHKIDHNLQNTTIEELMAHAKDLTLSNNQMGEKVANLTKQLDLKDLQTQNFAKQLEEVNKRAESLAKLYEEKRKEVEILIKLNEEKDQEDNILKKSEEQIEELGLIMRQFKQKTCEVEMLLNQTQEKQKQLKSVTRQNEEKSEEIENITKQLKDKSQELERLDSERELLETSFNEKEKDSDSTLHKMLNSQEERRNVNENTAEKVKEFQNKFDEEKEKSVNKVKKDLEEIQNLKAVGKIRPVGYQDIYLTWLHQAMPQEPGTPIPTRRTRSGQEPSEYQLRQSSLLIVQTDTAHFQEDPASFHGTQSSVKESQPFALAYSSGIGRITANPNDQTISFPDDDNAPDGPASLPRSEHLGEIASELRDEVMQLLPPIQEKEAEDKRMIGNAQQILQDVIEYRKNLDDIKKKFAARLSQVSETFAVKNN